MTNRAGEGLHLPNRVWVLPHSALSSRSKIVEHSILIEIVLIEELSGNFGQSGGLVHPLWGSRINGLSVVAHSIGKSLTALISATHSHRWHRALHVVSLK